MAEKEQRVKRVYEMPEVSAPQEEVTTEYRQKRVVAYCRVSTKQEEQLNSYETQRAAYIDMISKNPDWRLVKIFADKGITGTSVKNRDEFNKMIKLCKQGKVDMIITKSISRFARNTEDCLHYTRMLKRYGVDVYFEEQKLHSTQPGADFYIGIYGSIAQSESENISANVRWGKEQSAKQGNEEFSKIFMQMHYMEQSGRGVPTIVAKYGKGAYRFGSSFIECVIPYNILDKEKQARMKGKILEGENAPVNAPVNVPVKLNNTDRYVCKQHFPIR